MFTIGKHTYESKNIQVKTWGEGHKVTIGSFCSIADNLIIFTGGNHHTDYVTTYPFGIRLTNIFNNPQIKNCVVSNGDVVIGNDVWIGSHVTIMSGVKVGDGAVIAANSHVVKNVDPFTIVGGNPAKIIKCRFTPEQIQALLQIQWWNWDDEKINNFAHLLCSNDIQNFIDKVT